MAYTCGTIIEYLYHENGVAEWLCGYKVAARTASHLGSVRVRVRLGFKVKVRFTDMKPA